MSRAARVAAVPRTVPAVLALLLLGAHFLRAGVPVAVAGCIMMVGLLFVRRPIVRIFCRVCLAAGALEWVLTAWRIARFRIAHDQPYSRMLVILGAVAVFTALAAWLLPRVGPESRPGDDS